MYLICGLFVLPRDLFLGELALLRGPVPRAFALALLGQPRAGGCQDGRGGEDPSPDVLHFRPVLRLRKT